MDILPDIPVVFPSRPFSRASSVAEEPAQNLLLLRDFLREMRNSQHFSPKQNAIPSDRQLNDLSDGESILIPFLCSSINGRASMTKQHDTVTTQLATVPSIVATLPIASAIDSKLFPIQASLCDLSHRVSSAPPAPLATPRQPVPPPSVVTHKSAPPAVPKTRAPPPAKYNNNMSFDPDIPRYDPVRCVFYENPAPLLTSSLTHGRPTRFETASTQTPLRSSRVILTPTAPSPKTPTPRLPCPVSLRGAGRIRALPEPRRSRPLSTRSQLHKGRNNYLRLREGSTLLVPPPLNTLSPH